MVTMKLNINHDVKVKLTDYGREICHKQWSDTMTYFDRRDKFPYVPPKEDENGWSTWQLWDLMNTFGEVLYMGNPKLPFETEIEIIENENETASQ